MRKQPLDWYPRVMHLLLSALREDAAASMLEYAVILMLVALVALSAIELVGGQLSNVFNTAANVFSATQAQH